MNEKKIQLRHGQAWLLDILCLMKTVQNNQDFGALFMLALKRK